MRKFFLLATLLCSPVIAQEAPQNTNIAGPSASATGNVTNQAVQVLQGPYPIFQYGQGIACPGPSLSVGPFITGNLNGSSDPYSYQGHTGNAGVTLGFSIPLDGGLTELCKESARTWMARQQAETDKARLDFELVRALRCGEMMRNGVRFHPASPYAAVCADIITINTPVTPIVNEPTVSEGQGTQVPTTGS